MEALHKTAQALGQPDLAATATRGACTMLAIGRWRHGSAEVEAGDDAVGIVVALSEGQQVERRHAGRWGRKPCGIGLVTITNPEEATAFRITGRADVLQLFLPLALVAEAAGGRPWSVQPRFHEALPGIERCAWRALAALRDGEAGDALLLAAIACEAAGQLAGAPAAAGRARGGLSRRSLRRVDELIDHYLREPVATSPSLDELARRAEFSTFHFARAFRHSVGVAPYAYMLRRRLELARALLVRRGMTVAEAGRCAGFTSTAHFICRFHREMGITPGAFRRAAGP